MFRSGACPRTEHMLKGLTQFNLHSQDVLGADVYDWIMNQFKWYNDYFGYRG
jgi:hypothetical protein